MSGAAPVAVIDYGAGNLGNARRALESLRIPQTLIRSPADLPSEGPILLPGVGNYGTAMANLSASGVAGAIRDAAADRRIIGICIGLQLLLSESEEAPGVAGLGLIPGRVRRIESGGLPVPHLGWAPAGRTQSPVYFAHSFVVEPANRSAVRATATWGETFPAVVQEGSVLGFQFHPERSGKLGLEILARTLGGGEAGV